jgi:hypothetical protein
MGVPDGAAWQGIPPPSVLRNKPKGQKEHLRGAVDVSGPKWKATLRVIGWGDQIWGLLARRFARIEVCELASRPACPPSPN